MLFVLCPLWNLARASRWMGKEFIGRDRPSVAMRIGARLPACQLTSLSRSRSTRWTTHCENLFGGRFFFHGRERRPKVWVIICCVLNRVAAGRNAWRPEMQDAKGPGCQAAGSEAFVPVRPAMASISWESTSSAMAIMSRSNRSLSISWWCRCRVWNVTTWKTLDSSTSMAGV